MSRLHSNMPRWLLMQFFCVLNANLKGNELSDGSEYIRYYGVVLVKTLV